MADQPLPNVPYRVPIADDTGLLSSVWSAFFRSLYLRVGQAVALNNLELEALSGGAALQAEVDTLSAAVTANKTASDLAISNLLQGPVL